MSDESKPDKGKKPDSITSHESEPDEYRYPHDPANDGPFTRQGGKSRSQRGGLVPFEALVGTTRPPASSVGFDTAIKDREAREEISNLRNSRQPTPPLADACKVSQSLVDDWLSQRARTQDGPSTFRDLLNISAAVAAMRQPEKETDPLSEAMALLDLSPKVLTATEQPLLSELKAMLPTERLGKKFVLPEDLALVGVATHIRDLVQKQRIGLRYELCCALVDKTIEKLEVALGPQKSYRPKSPDWLEREHKEIDQDIFNAIIANVREKLLSPAQPPALDVSDRRSAGDARAEAQTPDEISRLVSARIVRYRETFGHAKSDVASEASGVDAARIAIVDGLVRNAAPKAELRLRRKDIDVSEQSDGDPTSRREALKRLYVCGLPGTDAVSSGARQHNLTEAQIDENSKVGKGQSQWSKMLRNLQYILLACDLQLNNNSDTRFTDLMFKLDLVRKGYEFEI